MHRYSIKSITQTTLSVIKINICTKVLPVFLWFAVFSINITDQWQKKSTKINILFTITHGTQELTSLQNKRQKYCVIFKHTPSEQMEG